MRRITSYLTGMIPFLVIIAASYWIGTHAQGTIFYDILLSQWVIIISGILTVVYAVYLWIIFTKRRVSIYDAIKLMVAIIYVMMGIGLVMWDQSYVEDVDLKTGDTIYLKQFTLQENARHFMSSYDRPLILVAIGLVLTITVYIGLSAWAKSRILRTYK